LFIATVSIDSPSVSDSRMNSWRWSVQVLHQAGHDLAQARVGRARQPRDDRLRDVVLGEIAQNASAATSLLPVEFRRAGRPAEAPWRK
jgi:hypothetical protein